MFHEEEGQRFFKLSEQSVMCFVMVLQKAIMGQGKISAGELFKKLDFYINPNDELAVANPPILYVPKQELEPEIYKYDDPELEVTHEE